MARAWGGERGADQVDAVARGEGEDVGAGDDPGAGGLDLRLNVVDDVEAEGGAAGVGAGALLAGRGGRVVEQQRGVAALEAPAFNSIQSKEKQSRVGLEPRTWTKQSWKKRRRMDAPIRGSAATACAIADRTMVCKLGHLRS